MSKYDYILDLLKEHSIKGKSHLNNFADTAKTTKDTRYPSRIASATESLANKIVPEDKKDLYKNLGLATGIGSAEAALYYYLTRKSEEDLPEDELLLEILANTEQN